jgi:hypothetical protein
VYCIQCLFMVLRGLKNVTRCQCTVHGASVGKVNGVNIRYRVAWCQCAYGTGCQCMGALAKEHGSQHQCTGVSVW